ncbi:Extracellular solute-binding protein family 1 [Paraburkholderia ribeironis]|uniref:Extracellular solute-binding protein family 1 n=1 Tax=Paraburkholderia ribeironis TaxID=1247936 RepID=A0A1N7SB34_9BURK|nr:sugar ABC transporter substrate-binding protein [Paraburkholderia ribeironis]SIT44619.1 Extracellular solute-binding protein family 1 [Paraburkholderia ribeironis]
MVRYKRWFVALGSAAALVANQAHADDISFWVRAPDSGFVTPVVKAWNANHQTKVNLTIIPADDFVTKFGTASAAGAAPDVVAIDLIFTPAFSQAGQLTDITDEAKKLPFYQSLSPSHMRLATYQNKIYALPFSAESSVLLYNKNLFRKAGLNPDQPPKNWAQLEEDARKITALGGGVKGFYFSGSCGGCNIFTLMPYVWASGGDVLSEDGKRATLDNAALKETLAMYRRMWQAGYMPTGAKTDGGENFISAFMGGKIGMVGSGAFSIGLLKKQHPELDFGLAYLPGKDGNWSSFAGGDVIAIPVSSQHKKEAMEFIKWCLSEQVQIDQFARNGSIPVRTDLASNDYSKLDARYEIASTAMAKGRTPYSANFNQLINDPNGPWLAMIQEAVQGKGVDAAVATAQQRFTQILSGQ